MVQPTKEHILYSSCLVVWLNAGELIIKSRSKTDSCSIERREVKLQERQVLKRILLIQDLLP